jgi:hypothetical protein
MADCYLCELLLGEYMNNKMPLPPRLQKMDDEYPGPFRAGKKKKMSKKMGSKMGDKVLGVGKKGGKGTELQMGKGKKPGSGI